MQMIAVVLFRFDMFWSVWYALNQLLALLYFSHIYGCTMNCRVNKEIRPKRNVLLQTHLFCMSEYHPVGRLFNSDWFVNSFTMVAYEKFFFSCPFDTKF